MNLILLPVLKSSQRSALVAHPSYPDYSGGNDEICLVERLEKVIGMRVLVLLEELVSRAMWR